MPNKGQGRSKLRDAPESVFAFNIGKVVEKESRKPFKSKNKVNTVKGIVLHPVTNIPAYTFCEDDSCVECWRCIPVS